MVWSVLNELPGCVTWSAHIPGHANKDMSTRSAYKCCVSGITLEPSDAIQLNGRVMHAQLALNWVQTYGPDVLPDGTGPVPESLRPSTSPTAERPLGPLPVPLTAKQQAFVAETFNASVTRAVAGAVAATEWPKLFLYIKVLMAWFIVVDPRNALETFARTMQLCESLESVTSQVEALLGLLSRALSGMLEDPDNATTVATLDAQKAVVSRYSIPSLSDAVLRYADLLNGGVNPFTGDLSALFTALNI